MIADSFFMVKKTREHISLRGVSTEVSISLSKSNIRGILQRVQYTMQTSYRNKDRKGRLDTNIYKNLNEPQKSWSSILWTREAQISLQPKLEEKIKPQRRLGMVYDLKYDGMNRDGFPWHWATNVYS